MNIYKALDCIKDEEDITIYKHLHTEPEPEHLHDFYELVYIFEGKGTHTVNGVSKSVSIGDILFLSFNDTHSFVPDGSMGVLNCLLKPSFIDTQLQNSRDFMDVLALNAFHEFKEFTNHFTFVCSFSGKNFIDVERLFENMLQEFTEKECGYKIVLRGYIDTLLVLIFRQIKYLYYHPTVQKENMKISPQILDHIEKNYNKKISLMDLAGQSYYNPSYFSTLFKDSFGVTLSEYINQKRIFMAIKYLEETDVSVEKIRCMVGFKNKNQFYKKFFEATGYTPNNYRKFKLQ